MNSDPSTPVRVPKAANTYTASTQDPDLRSQINTVLLRDGHIAKIQDTLLHALHASPSNWPTQIQNHALALLRSGEYTKFPALMSRVLEDIKADTAVARGAEAGSNGTNGAKAKKVNGTNSGKAEAGRSLAVPKNVVDEGVRITRECLEMVVEVTP